MRNGLHAVDRCTITMQESALGSFNKEDYDIEMIKCVTDDHGTHETI